MGSELHHWQHPYVNIAKVWRLDDDSKKTKKGLKKGDVKLETSKDIRSNSWRISGSVSSQNYVQFPAQSGSLKLTGRYCYLAFRPRPNKYFVVHFDVTADEGPGLRLSFSNMYKVAKVSATGAQFPFLVAPAPNSVDGTTGSKGVHGVAPASARWERGLNSNPL